MKLAHRLASIKPSATLEITAKAAALRDQGVDVIGLGAGEPDFDTPDIIKQGGIKAIEHGFTKYTPVDGLTTLKKAIINKIKTSNCISYELNEVIVGTGAKQILFNALFSCINPGDHVLVPSPYWVSYPDMVSLAQGETRFVQCPEENSFKLTAEALDNAITNKTRCLILNSPSNPTGMLYTKDELISLASVLRLHPQILIICDDIYEFLVYDNLKFHTLVEVAPDLKNRILIVNGVSKGYAMTGWRIGWGCGPAELIAGMKKIQSQTTSNPCTIAQYAALEALSQKQNYLTSWLISFKERRDFVVKTINDCPGLSCSRPNGAFYVYISCKDLMNTTTPQGRLLKNDLDLCSYFLEEANVAVVPGEAFGLSPYFRISYATSLENLQQACQRIKNACKKLKKLDSGAMHAQSPH